LEFEIGLEPLAESTVFDLFEPLAEPTVFDLFEPLAEPTVFDLLLDPLAELAGPVDGTMGFADLEVFNESD